MTIKVMTRKRVFYSIMIFFLAVLTGAAVYLSTLLPIITGYAAKNLCSAVFVSGREAEDVESADLNFSFIKYTHNKISEDQKSVSSRFLWGRSKAIYREGFGVTLLSDVSEKKLRKVRFPSIPEPQYSQDTIAWPLGNVLPDSINTGINLTQLNDVTGKLFNDKAYGGNPYAFMVLHKGIPVAEAYKPPFNKNTRFLSWSMAKSFTNALAGMLVKNGKMDISKPVDIKEWKKDERSKITWNDLLQMQSGLKWNEDYGNRSNVNVMLHCVGDMGEYAFDRPAEYPAGTHWYYSSGTANIVSYLIRKQFNNDSSYYAFAETQLFDKLGMPDAEFEVDPSGTLVGSSYIYATARDYARFGLLYLNDGVLNGERILPEGWVTYTRTPASDSKGEYGAFFWLNKGKTLPSVPGDVFYCQGHDGQAIYILPDEELVVVILGYSPRSNQVNFDRLLKDIIDTL